MIKNTANTGKSLGLLPDCLLAIGSIATAAAAFGEIGFDVSRLITNGNARIIFGDYTPLSLFCLRLFVGFEFSVAAFLLAARREYRDGKWQQKILRARGGNKFDRTARDQRVKQAVLLKGSVAAVSVAFAIYAAELTASFFAPPARPIVASAITPANVHFFEKHKR